MELDRLAPCHYPISHAGQPCPADQPVGHSRLEALVIAHFTEPLIWEILTFGTGAFNSPYRGAYIALRQ